MPLSVKIFDSQESPILLKATLFRERWLGLSRIIARNHFYVFILQFLDNLSCIF